MMLDEKDADWRSRGIMAKALVDRLLRDCPIMCDLCSESAVCTGAVWTCVNGERTVFHPTAYDVCEPCFFQYAGIEGLPEGSISFSVLRPEEDQDSLPHRDRWSSATAALRTLSSRFRVVRFPVRQQQRLSRIAASIGARQS